MQIRPDVQQATDVLFMFHNSSIWQTTTEEASLNSSFPKEQPPNDLYKKKCNSHLTSGQQAYCLKEVTDSGGSPKKYTNALFFFAYCRISTSRADQASSCIVLKNFLVNHLANRSTKQQCIVLLFGVRSCGTIPLHSLWWQAFKELTLELRPKNNAG